MAKKEKKEDVWGGMGTFGLVLVAGSWGLYGYAHMKLGAHQRAEANEKKSLEHVIALDRQQRALDRGRSSTQEAAAKEYREARAAREEAQLAVMLPVAGNLTLAFIGALFGFVALAKTKWQLAKIGKRLKQRWTALLALLAGLAALYIGGGLLYQFS